MKNSGNQLIVLLTAKPNDPCQPVAEAPDEGLERWHTLIFLKLLCNHRALLCCFVVLLLTGSPHVAQVVLEFAALLPHLRNARVQVCHHFRLFLPRSQHLLTHSSLFHRKTRYRSEPGGKSLTRCDVQNGVLKKHQAEARFGNPGFQQ